MADRQSSDAISDQIKLLTQISTHPALRQILSEIQKAPAEQRLATAERIASVDALAAKGVEIPKGLKISTRYFENPNAVVRGDVMMNPKPDLMRAAGGTLCVSVGEIICVSYGWETAQ